jgi:hypothetical protein
VVFSFHPELHFIHEGRCEKDACDNSSQADFPCFLRDYDYLDVFLKGNKYLNSFGVRIKNHNRLLRKQEVGEWQKNS